MEDHLSEAGAALIVVRVSNFSVGPCANLQIPDSPHGASAALGAATQLPTQPLSVGLCQT